MGYSLLVDLDGTFVLVRSLMIKLISEPSDAGNLSAAPFDTLRKLIRARNWEHVRSGPSVVGSTSPFRHVRPRPTYVFLSPVQSKPLLRSGNWGCDCVEG